MMITGFVIQKKGQHKQERMRQQQHGSKQQQKQYAKAKELPGGLVLVHQLNEYPLSKIYWDLVRARFNFDDNNVGLSMAQQILTDLKVQPGRLNEFICKSEHYNRIAWAHTNQELQDNSCNDCELEFVRLMCDSALYKMQVDRKFLEMSEMREDVQLKFFLNGAEKAKPLYGQVHRIEQNSQTLFVKFRDENNMPLVGQLYEAIIQPSSLIYRSRCRTLETISTMQGWEECIFTGARELLARELLLPEKEYNRLESQFLSRTRFSHRRQFNDNQKRAIFAAVSGLHGPCPYILFGPPGTGKTVTLVEAIRLLFEQNQGNARVLVCTPSNTAADAFTLELLETGAFPAGTILRIFSLSKKVHEQNPLIPFHALCTCPRNDGETQFGIPSKEELLERQVLICTLNTSTYLVSGDLENCFTHIVIDEAGQADELETLIPIVGLTEPQDYSIQLRLNRRGTRQRKTVFPGTRIILAGDPQQLGPVQMCDFLKRWSNPISLLERLINGGSGRTLDSFHFDKRITTMLEDNYRSHPALVTIPSALYYGGRLRPSAPIHEKNTLCRVKWLPKKEDFPLLWFSVEGKEICENGGEGNSKGNMEECKVVCDFVDNLVRKVRGSPGNRAKVEASEIGIITPYRYQGKLLRQMLHEHKDLVIDSVERFQGCERRVIIISTVRSTGTGFLDCAKRFNTAITRPMELLIIVGSSQNMRRIDGWRQLIHYCEDSGALLGQTELTIVQKQPAALYSKSNRNHNPVDTLGRTLGHMNMADWMEKQRPANKNTGLSYRMDEEFKQKMQLEVNEPLPSFVNAPKMKGMKKRRVERGGEPQLQEMMFYERFRNPQCNSDTDATCPTNDTFHISASQVGQQQFYAESSTTSLVRPPQMPNTSTNSSSTGNLMAYTKADAIASSVRKAEEANQNLAMAKERSSSPDDDEFESTSSHGITPIAADSEEEKSDIDMDSSSTDSDDSSVVSISSSDEEEDENVRIELAQASSPMLSHLNSPLPTEAASTIGTEDLHLNELEQEMTRLRLRSAQSGQ